MTRLNVTLLAAIALELAVGGAVLGRRAARTAPPVPDQSDIEPPVAAELARRLAACETAADWSALGEFDVAYGYFAEGEACYRVAAERDPGNPARAYEWAFALERIGRLDEADGAYARAAELGHPRPEECWYNVGRNRLRAEDAAGAKAAFAKAGDQPSARYEVAAQLQREGRSDEAIRLLEKLTLDFPKAVKPLLLRHRIELVTGGPCGAETGDRAARALGRLPTPFDGDWKRLETAYEQVGTRAEMKAVERLFAVGKTAEAAPLVDKLARESWDDSIADYAAELEFGRGRPKEAARLLQDAVDRAGGTAHLWKRLGEAHFEAGRPDLAARAWEQATHFGIGDEAKNALARLAQNAEKQGRTEEAKTYTARALYGTGHELYWAGDLRGAREALQQAVALRPGLAAAWLYLGELAREQRRPEDAAAAYRKCLEAQPENGRARRGLSLLNAK